MKLPRNGLETCIFIVTCSLLLLGVFPDSTAAQNGQASIYLSPSQGSVEVGATFDVSFYVNTGGQAINTVSLDVRFPANKLQIVNPTAGKSFIEIWVTRPEYSNTNGTISLQGGLPSPGVNTSAGLITTVTFRAKSTGEALVYIEDSSQVLANDGNGTNLLTSFGRGTYQIEVPPPAGPVVFSPSHPDQNKWYRENNVCLSWTNGTGIIDGFDEATLEYSWALDDDPLGVPDNKTEGKEVSTCIESVENGIWYFHVKTTANGKWGATSHFTVKVDSEKPAEFSAEVSPLMGPSDVRRVVRFITTDRHSGMDHYEIKIDSMAAGEGSVFFTEAVSPYAVKELPDGEYQAVVRAFDVAGNFRESSVDFQIKTSLIQFYGGTLSVFGYHVPLWAIGVFALVVLIVSFFVWRWWKRRYGDPSDQVEKYLQDVKTRMSRRKAEIAEMNREDKEIKEVLKEELEQEMSQNLSGRGDKGVSEEQTNQHEGLKPKPKKSGSQSVKAGKKK